MHTQSWRRWPKACLFAFLALGSTVVARAQGTLSTDYTEVYGVDDAVGPANPPAIGYISYAQPGQRETIITDPCDDSIMIMPTWGSGVWRSDDGGLTWLPKSNGLLNLLVDIVRPDPSICGRYYAAQAPEGGVGVGYIYRTDDRGDTWKKVALTSTPLPPRMYVTDLAVGAGTLWVGVSNSANACGATLRSDDAGQSWCAFQNVCEMAFPGVTLCPTGRNQFPVNDTYSLDAVTDPVTGDAETYWSPSKIHWPVMATHRSPADINAMDWEQRDYFADETCPIRDPAAQCPPVATAPPAGCTAYDWWWDCNRLNSTGDYRAGERLRAADIAVDPYDDTHRFARHKSITDPNCHGSPYNCSLYDQIGCNTQPVATYCDWDTGMAQCEYHCLNESRYGFDCCSINSHEMDFSLVYTDGTRDTASPLAARRNDIVWHEILPIRDFVSSTAAWDVDTIAFTPPRPGAPNILFATLGPFLLSCDATNGSQACFDPANWECVWNVSNEPGGAALNCPTGTDWFSQGVRWERMSISPNLGPDGINDLYYTSARRIGQLDILRVRKQNGQWTEERLVDPRDCSESGPTLVTPTQILETSNGGFGPVTMIASSPRDLLLSSDGGQTWSPPPGALRKFNSGGVLGQSPVNRQVLYHANLVGIARSDDGGVTWNQVEGHFNAPGVQNACFNTNAGGCPGGCPPTSACTLGRAPGGRAQVMSDGIVALGVDSTDDKRLIAATERGIWKWQYPFGTFPFACLTWDGAVCAGEAWVRVYPPADPTPPSVPAGPYVYCVEQDPYDPLKWYAGAEGNLLLKSVDGGNTWTSSNVGFTAKDILIANGTTYHYFAAADDGVWASPDGITFTRTLAEAGARALSVSPLIVNGYASIVAAVTNYGTDDVRDGLYLSASSGAAWSKLVSDDFNQNFVSVLWSSQSGIVAGKVGDGIFRRNIGPTLDCGRLLPTDTFATSGSDGFGWAIAGLGDSGVGGGGGPDCRDDWASMEFVAGSQVRVRILDGTGADLRPPLDPGDPATLRGGSVTGVGDIDGDSCTEVSVGLLHANPLADSVRIINACTGTIVSTLTPGVAGFGFSQDSDGSHLAVGAPQSGRVRVFPLPALSPVVTINTPGTPGDRFGWDVEFGNVDGAGGNELLISAVNANGGVGRVYVYRNTGTNWVLSTSLSAALPPGSLFGWSISSGIDGLGTAGPDGKHDIVVGAPGGASGSGLAYVYRQVGDPSPVIVTGSGGERLGSSVLVTGDVTGDSLPDYLFGAPSRNGRGGVSIHQGLGSSLSSWCNVDGSTPGGQLGAALARLGDADQNLSIDVLVADPTAGTGQVKIERVEF